MSEFYNEDLENCVSKDDDDGKFFNYLICYKNK